MRDALGNGARRKVQGRPENEDQDNPDNKRCGGGFKRYWDADDIWAGTTEQPALYLSSSNEPGYVFVS